MSVFLLCAGGHAGVVLAALKSNGIVPDGIADVDPKLLGAVVGGVPVIGTDADLLAGGSDLADIFNGLGNIPHRETPGMGPRRKLFEAFSAAGFRFPPLVASGAICVEGSKLDAGAQVMAGAIVQSGAEIGANSIVNSGAIIEHDCRIGAHCHIAPGAVICGGVHIGEECHIGAGAIVLPGITIEGGTVVPAGEIVRHGVQARKH